MSNNDNTTKIIKQLVDIKTSEYNRIEIDLSISKSGLTCLYECGGAYSNNASAQLVTDSHGNKKTALKVFNKGDLCNKNHAVIPVVIGDMVFIAEGNKDGMSVLAYRIVEINLDSKKAILELSDFNDNILPFLAAANKAWTYHCREACYIKEPNRGGESNEQRTEKKTE